VSKKLVRQASPELAKEPEKSGFRRLMTSRGILFLGEVCFQVARLERQGFKQLINGTVSREAKAAMHAGV